jgi:hypothetical protein
MKINLHMETVHFLKIQLFFFNFQIEMRVQMRIFAAVTW